MTYFPENTPGIDWSAWSLCADGAYFMIPLIVLLLIILYVSIERTVFVISAGIVNPGLMQRIKDYIHENEIESAENFCRREATPCSRTVLSGIGLIGQPMADINDTMHTAASVEIASLKKLTFWLPFAAWGAPLLGLLGAIIGTLSKIAADPAIDSPALLFTPLATLAAGIIVGFVALACYFFLKSRLNSVKIVLKRTISGFLQLLNEPAA